MSDKKTFEAGDRILSKGEEASKAYMILSGEVRVFLEDGTKTVELARLGQNEVFGESALLGGEPYGASIEAIEKTTLLPITPESFQERLEGVDPIIKTLLAKLLSRLKSTNEALVKSETREFMDIDLV